MVRLAAVGGHPRACRYRLSVGLRDTDALAGTVVDPAVVATHEEAIDRAAFGEPCGAMAAAVSERGRPVLGIEKQHDFFHSGA
jgi:hypothetical protein